MDRYARVVELVDTQDLKSCDFGHAGSIPAPGTTNELKGFLEAQRWDARSASQGFPPDFPNEFRIFGALARTNFSPRSRFEIRSNFDIVFALIQKEFLPFFQK